MDKHSSIAQAEAAAACVGIILLGFVIATIILVVIIIYTKSKMKEQSQFTIHVSRNFNREKETPVSELEGTALKSTTKIDLDEGAMDNPLYHTNSFGHGGEIVRPMVTTGFHNRREDCDDGSNSSEGPAEENTAHVYDQPDIPETFSPVKTTTEGISPGSAQPEGLSPDTVYNTPKPVTPEKTTPSKSPVPAPRPSPKRPPPMIPIIKPKPYTGGQSPAKPPVGDKPKRPILPPIEAQVKPEVKPKPKPRPHS